MRPERRPAMQSVRPGGARARPAAQGRNSPRRRDATPATGSDASPRTSDLEAAKERDSILLTQDPRPEIERTARERSVSNLWRLHGRSATRQTVPGPGVFLLYRHLTPLRPEMARANLSCLFVPPFPLRSSGLLMGSRVYTYTAGFSFF